MTPTRRMTPTNLAELGYTTWRRVLWIILYLSRPLEREKTYRWIVDCHDPDREPEKTQGFLWTFNTNNLAPVVNAGANQYIC